MVRAPRTDPYDRVYLRLLQMGPFQRRDGWRFGTKRLGDHVVARLLLAGRATQAGDLITLTRKDVP